MTELDIRHDAGDGRFYVALEGSEAYLDYERLNEHTLDFRQTFVPHALRGRGIATALARYALSYAQQNGFRVVPTCSFVAATIRRDPSFHGLVVV